MFSIDHIGVAVKSLAAAKGIYEKLGLKLSPQEAVEAEQVRVVMVPLGESRIELLEPISADSVIAKFIAKRGEGLHHVSLRVPDLETAVERLKKDGVRLVSEQIKIGAGGHRYGRSSYQGEDSKHFAKDRSRIFRRRQRRHRCGLPRPND